MAMNRSKGLWMGALGLGAATALLVLSSTQVGAETEAKSPESKPTEARRACLYLDRVASRRVVGPNKMLIEDGFGRSALLTLSQPCSRIDDLDMIGFEFYGSNTLCDKHDVKILHSRNGETPLTCLITDLKLMSRAEAKAFEDQEKDAPKAS